MLLLILGLLWGFLTWLGDTGELKPHSTFYIEATNIGGIRIGDPVWLEGYEVGKVSSISQKKSMPFSWCIQINMDTLYSLQKGATASIGNQEITGGKVILLKQGNSQSPCISGDTILAMGNSDIQQVLASISSPLKMMGDTIFPMIIRVLHKTDQLLVPEQLNSLSATVIAIRSLVTSLQQQFGSKTYTELPLRLHQILLQSHHTLHHADSLMNQASSSIYNLNQVLQKSDSALVLTTQALTALTATIPDSSQFSASLAGKVIQDATFKAQTDSLLNTLQNVLHKIERGELKARVRF